MEKTLSLVIPCLNEEQAAPLVLKTIEGVRSYLIEQLAFDEVQVIVVDDASRDRSAEIAASFSFVELVQNKKTQGYGASLKTGFEKSRGQWICFLDMDNSYPPQHIPKMWNLLVSDKLDMVLGSRAFRSEGMSLIRGLGNSFFSILTRIFLRTSIRDVCSGFRLFHRNCLPEILSISESTLGYSLEMSIRLSSLGWKAKELRIDYLPRTGTSKLSVWRDGWKFLFLILSAARKLYFQPQVRK